MFSCRTNGLFAAFLCKRHLHDLALVGFLSAVIAVGIGPHCALRWTSHAIDWPPIRRFMRRAAQGPSRCVLTLTARAIGQHPTALCWCSTVDGQDAVNADKWAVPETIDSSINQAVRQASPWQQVVP
jgi:hypothetical protein